MDMSKVDRDATNVEEAELEAQAEVDIWKYIFGFVEMAVVKCAIELRIANVIDSRDGRPVTLSELSSDLSDLGCVPSEALYRIMRFLTGRKIFAEKTTTQDSAIRRGYIQTPLSRRLMTHGKKSMAAFVLLESSPMMMPPWHCLSGRVLDEKVSAFEAAHGREVWSYAEANPANTELINQAMACDARVTVPAIINGCPEVLEGLSSIVDVGGGNGTAMSILVKSCPWIRGINFDLPHVVSVLPECDGVEHVGGNMFDSVPKADAAFIMWVLHDWNDEECIQILKNCRKSISKDKGKVIIVEAIIEEEGEESNENKFKDVGLMLDMVMMAHTNTGKERTLKEWAYVLREAGFSRHTVKYICAVKSIIEAYP